MPRPRAAMRKIRDHAARRIMRRGGRSPLVGGDVDRRRRRIITRRPIRLMLPPIV